MGTKNNPGGYDCYAKLADDEPSFLLRANDPLSPTLVRLWAFMYRLRKGVAITLEQRRKADEAENVAADMELWRGHNEFRKHQGG